MALSADAALVPVVTLDPQRTFQTIEAFGGFGPAKVWWDEPPYYDEQYIATIVDDLGVNMVRTQLYWDFEPVNDDADPNHFEWSRFDVSAASNNGKQLPFLRALRARNVRIIASVWTPPVWMKQNHDDSLARFCKGQCAGTLRADQREEFAEYLVAYVKWLAREGIELYALSIANEPLFANPFESCVYSEPDYAATLRVVGRRFEREALGVKLFGPEHMGSYAGNQRFFREVLDDPHTRKYLDVYAVHTYLDGFSSDFGTAEGWRALGERTRAERVPLWMSETSDYERKGWDKARYMAVGLHGALKEGGITAWIYWYMADDLLVNGRPQPVYHAFKHFYRFVRPGFVQIQSGSSDSDLLVTAFTGQGRTVLVVINLGKTRKPLLVQGLPVGSKLVEAWQTTERQPFVKLPSVSPRAFDVPARGFVTAVWAH